MPDSKSTARHTQRPDIFIARLQFFGLRKPWCVRSRDLPTVRTSRVISKMRSSPKTKSWPLTSSLLKCLSSAAAYGARLERNRIQTEVSTKTIMLLRDQVPKPARAAVESRVRVARIREAPAAARTRRGERAPRGRDEPYLYLS